MTEKVEIEKVESRNPGAVVASALDWTTHTYQVVHVAETDEQAREELETILRSYQDAIEREAAFNARAEANEANTKTDRTPNALTEDWIGTWCLYGSPETVLEHLKPYAELGIGNILRGYHDPGNARRNQRIRTGRRSAPVAAGLQCYICRRVFSRATGSA